MGYDGDAREFTEGVYSREAKHRGIFVNHIWFQLSINVRVNSGRWESTDNFNRLPISSKNHLDR